MKKTVKIIAAVLALRPRVLLLDEPTSQLDPVAEKNFLHALFRVNRELGCTVVVATHQPRPMLEYATCAYRIEDGHVREVADMASLGRRESLFSDDMLGWGAVRCAKNGVFSRREDNLGSLEPPGDVSSAKNSSELDKSSEFVAQTSLENGSEAFPRTDGSRILQKNARRVGYHPGRELVSLRSRGRLGSARARRGVFGRCGACDRGRQRMR